MNSEGNCQGVVWGIIITFGEILQGKYFNIMFQVHLFSQFVCSVMGCKHVTLILSKEVWQFLFGETLFWLYYCLNYLPPLPSVKKKFYFDKHLVTSCPLIIYIWSCWPPQPAYIKLIFSVFLFTSFKQAEQRKGWGHC
jgi:hypothetical protein